MKSGIHPHKTNTDSAMAIGSGMRDMEGRMDIGNYE